jgi:hypothetical protein
MSDSPIFIHSLFRAGSTYLFSRLRRDDALFCYYESMHELVAWASEDVSRLDMETSAEKMQQLHHPVLDADYFDELKQVWPAWQNRLAPGTVYGGYFAETPKAAGQAFFEALSEASPKKTVFSECRTAGRIGALKQGMGGHHAYLWRNPRDQWWSYQIDPYFDAASRVIAHADPLPAPLAELLNSLDWARSPQSGFSEARDFYDLRPAPFIKSYTWFYGLWLFLLDHARDNADLLINIDSLSGSPEHQDAVVQTLADWGASGIDLSDAASPAAHYAAEELEVFSAAEARVHEIFIQSGWHSDRLGKLSALREAHSPNPRSDAPEQQLATSERRTLLANWAVGVRRTEAWAGLYKRQAEVAAAAQHDAAALHRALEHDRKVLVGLKKELGDVSELTSELTAATHELGLARRYIGDMQASASWRVTFPLRALSGQLGRLFAGIKTLSPTGAGLGRTMVAVSSRFPTLFRQLSRLLIYTPALRQWLVKWLDLPPAGAIKKSDLNPRELSVRGKALYNKLARDLDMSELDETAPAGVREQAGNGK